jgi:class 3 adenylate cyclase
MKRLAISLAAIAPALGLIFFRLRPEADLNANLPLFHFYVVTFTTFSAAVISLLLTAALGREAEPRHVLAAGAFAVIGGAFFSHGLATPNALIDYSHPAVQWSAWITLFGGGALFAVAGFDRPGGSLAWPQVRRTVVAAIAAVLGYSAVAAFAPQWLSAVDNAFSTQVIPWHRYTIFVLTLGLWLFASFRLWQTWRATQSNTDGVLAFVAFWLATATVSMHLFPVWHLSWWLYHAVLLIGFLITAGVLAAQYEQVRQFRLTRYYLAASLILTAMLALAASALFTQFAYNTLVAQIMNTSRSTADNLANGLASDMTEVTTSADLDNAATHDGMETLVELRMAGLQVNSLVVYDADGVVVLSTAPELVGVRASDQASFAGALRGETRVVLHPPEAAPAAYTPSRRVHVIETFAPLRPGGDPAAPAIGVLSTLEEAPALDKATLNARVTGLATAAVSMGLLFVALLSVVGRADHILTLRTDELRRVSNQLKMYSEWLLGRDLLGRVLSDPAALSLMRHERTVLFMDIRGFTRWSEARTPEEVVRLLNRYYNAVEATVTRHGVIKFKFSADEAMAVFPEANRAVAAALELRRAVQELLEPEQLGAGIGLHTGALVEGLLGSQAVKFYDVIGDTVNTAKRIESSSVAGEALVSQSTRSLMGAQFSVGESRQIEAKGKEAPLTVHPLR